MSTTIPVADLLLPLATAAAAGWIGAIAVMRRMTLASDAISHVALPGIGIALLLRVNPVLGGLAALLLGTLLVWALEQKARVPTEAIIGVVFSAALAVGGMLTSGEDLIEALFGAPGPAGRLESLVGMGAAILVIGFVRLAESRLVIALVSPDLARTAGIHVARMDLFYLLSFALTVALGLRFLGVLLMGSLLIIPASTAKHLARGLGSMRWISIGVAMFSTAAGSVLAARLHREPGPLVITVAAVIFFVSLGKRREG
jgi:ABC-type Mn2+/Zn2+ transport system permease subunit